MVFKSYRATAECSRLKLKVASASKTLQYRRPRRTALLATPTSSHPTSTSRPTSTSQLVKPKEKMEEQLLQVDLDSTAWQHTVAEAALAKPSRCYVHCNGPSMSCPDGVGLVELDKLALLYDVLALTEPRCEMVPLLPAAGWTHEKVANLPGGVQIMVTSSQEGSAAAKLDQLNKLRGEGLPAWTPAPSPPAARLLLSSLPDLADRPGQLRQMQGKTGQGLRCRLILPNADAATAVAAAQGRLQFQHVACGGTFDRLHAGHMLLLAAAALVTTERLYVGITADALLVKKAHREMIQGYDQRLAVVEGFVQAVRPGLALHSGVLVDPQAPTQAELDPVMEALVASEETLQGALSINEGRRRRGFNPLTLILVPVIGLTQQGKLSSTDLRLLEASGQHPPPPQHTTTDTAPAAAAAVAK